MEPNVMELVREALAEIEASKRECWCPGEHVRCPARIDKAEQLLKGVLTDQQGDQNHAALPSPEEWERTQREAAAFRYLESQSHEFEGLSGEHFTSLEWPGYEKQQYTLWPSHIGLLEAIEAAQGGAL